jgi:UDP-glucose:(glucosyl)LPS alpha-1,2-glucosyltransferase
MSEVTTAPVTTSPLPPSAPMGGTELILANLKAALPDLTDQVQIIMSRPEQVLLEDKPRILWLQDLPQDPASACLRDATYRTNFNKIVFCSHWQQHQYHIYLGIPYTDGVVIKNAVPNIGGEIKKSPVDKDNKLRFIYTSTPHRGLPILAAVADHLATERQDWQLDVYSSLNIYGWHEQDKQFTELYDKLKANPCVNYHGSVPNAQVRDAVKDAHVFVYPSIYQETSCMAIQEALMAGCLGITSNFGALPETCAEWAWMFQYSENPEDIAQKTYAGMSRALDSYNNDSVQQVLQLQRWYYQTFYSFESRVPVWKSLLEHVIAQGKPEPMLILD